MNQNVRVQRQKFQNELNVTLKNVYGKKGFVSVLWKCFGLKTTSFNECSVVVNIV